MFHHHFLEYIQFWTEIYGSVSHAFFLLQEPQNWVRNCAWVSTYNISEPTARSTNFWQFLLPFSIGVWGWGLGCRAVSILTCHELNQTDTVVQAGALELLEVKITFLRSAPQNHFTARPTSQLMLKYLQISAPWKAHGWTDIVFMCDIWGSLSGDGEGTGLTGCYTVWTRDYLPINTA